MQDLKSLEASIHTWFEGDPAEITRALLQLAIAEQLNVANAINAAILARWESYDADQARILAAWERIAAAIDTRTQP